MQRTGDPKTEQLTNSSKSTFCPNHFIELHNISNSQIKMCKTAYLRILLLFNIHISQRVNHAVYPLFDTVSGWLFFTIPHHRQFKKRTPNPRMSREKNPPTTRSVRFTREGDFFVMPQPLHAGGVCNKLPPSHLRHNA